MTVKEGEPHNHGAMVWPANNGMAGHLLRDKLKLELHIFLTLGSVCASTQ